MSLIWKHKSELYEISIAYIKNCFNNLILWYILLVGCYLELFSFLLPPYFYLHVFYGYFYCSTEKPRSANNFVHGRRDGGFFLKVWMQQIMHVVLISAPMICKKYFKFAERCIHVACTLIIIWFYTFTLIWEF